MSHLSDGELHSIIDQQNPEAYQSHIESCPKCQQRLEAMTRRAAWVKEHLTSLDAQIVRPPLSTPVARAHLQTLFQNKEKTNMWKRIFAPRFRTAWTAFAIVAILAGSMAFPQVRAIAVDFLGLFRVKQIALVQFNPANLPSNMESAASGIEQLFAEDLTVQGMGDPTVGVSTSEASQAAGIPIRLPTSLTSQPDISIQPGGSITFKVNLDKVKGILAQLDRPVDLPDSLNGATVTADIPTSVTAAYGNCKKPNRGDGYDPDMPETYALRDCTVVLQMPSPSVSAPAGTDVDAVAQAFLQLMGMSKEDAVSFTQKIDLSTTLILPVPMNAKSGDVQVDGVEGVFVQNSQSSHSSYMLAWVKNDILYSVSGAGTLSEALKIADSLQ
jgi:hypothetical protein